VGFVLYSSLQITLKQTAEKRQEKESIKYPEESIEQAWAEFFMGVSPELKKQDSVQHQKLLQSIRVKAQHYFPQGKQTQGAIDSLRHLLYKDWGVSFSDDAALWRNIFPAFVVEKKEASCLGVSLLIFLIAKEVSLPVDFVRLPGHIYIRWNFDSTAHINFEPNRQGWRYSDEEYYVKYELDDPKNRAYRSLQSLSERELLALAEYGRARAMEEVMPERAEFWYKRSLLHDPNAEESAGSLLRYYIMHNQLDKALVLAEQWQQKSKDPRFKELYERLRP
jgi:regulator of sirC expression with transglutaminase-like and TPR domain